MGFKFPYGNQQQLNLDWFIRKFKELVAAWNEKEESIDGALDAEIQRAEDALTDVYTARDVAVAAKNDALTAKADALTAAANSAQYWQNSAASAQSAATSAGTALSAAGDAAADAQQTARDRASVTADKAAVAADKATVAADKATVAADKATVAADKATVAQDKADTDTIKDNANAAALRAEGWADGTQYGTPVTSDSPYYENNAKYYKEAAEDVLESIPADYSELAAEVASQSEKIDEVKNALLQNYTEEYNWAFSSNTYAGIINVIRFPDKQTSHSGTLKSVTLGVRPTDSGSVSIVLAEIDNDGLTGTTYAVIPVNLHSNPDVNNEYINGVDFNYSGEIRKNTVFGIWANHSVQVLYGTETVRSYGIATENPDNLTFSTQGSYHNSYNVAVGYKVEYLGEKAEKVIVLGDSWTDIVNTTYIRWPVLLNNMNRFNVKSYGVSGATVSGNVSTQVSNFLSELPDADTVILMGGVNDYRGGVSLSNVVTSITGYYNSIKAIYPDVRFIYIANNQLYYSAEQLHYFNSIVEQLNYSEVEAYVSFAWCAPNQYADDFIHPGNAGNVLIANNIANILRGGQIKTVLNKYHWDFFDGTNRIGQFNIFEIFENGWPRIEIRGVASSAMANTTKTMTMNSRTMFVSAPWTAAPYSIADINKRCMIHTPNSEVLDSNHQVTSFEITLVLTNAGTEFTTSANGFKFTA